MDARSYDELVALIYENRELCSKISYEIDSLSLNPFSKDRIKRRKLRNKLEDIHDEIEEYKDIIDIATTFKRYKLLNFFCEFLSITEQEPIIVTKVTEVEEDDDDFTMGASFVALGTCLSNPCLTTIGLINMLDDGEEERTNYYLVSNESISQALQYTYDNDIDEALDEIEAERCFYVSDSEIHMANGMVMKRQFRVFPQLRDAFERLIDLYLSNPELTDEERFEKIIRETKGKKFLKKS